MLKVNLEDRGDQHQNPRNRLVHPNKFSSSILDESNRHETHRSNHESDKVRVIASPDAVVDPLAVVVAAIHTVVALKRSVGQRLRRIYICTITILQWLERGGR